MRALSLFSGCGGLDLGAVRAGASIEFANDIDSAAREAYGRILEAGFVSGQSVTELESLPRAELWLAGYPCQSFSDAGLRRPDADPRSRLFADFVRLLRRAEPEYFVVENVPGLARRAGGRLLAEQLRAFLDSGRGYELSARVLRAEDFGVPQKRRRLVIVGVRRDLGKHFWFPEPTHGSGLRDFVSHGDVIRDLPEWPVGEFYEHVVADHNFSAYYRSRNRKAAWDGPSLTVLASWRHTTLHPASPDMVRVSQVERDRNWQAWEFVARHSHLESDPTLPAFERPRRLAVREVARLQGIPEAAIGHEEPRAAFRFIGNAVPPAIGEAVVRGIVTQTAFRSEPSPDAVDPLTLRLSQTNASAVPKPGKDSRIQSTGASAIAAA